MAGALFYHGHRGIAEFALKISMLLYDNLLEFRGTAEFGVVNRGKILPWFVENRISRIKCWYIHINNSQVQIGEQGENDKDVVTFLFSYFPKNY